uniref:Large ribosomal subunit protein uL4c n=1 Tax=Rhodochaete parvula TaxID=110510 RepID=A0A1C9CI69_9RHOD|nr:ribosomal protein L4 [Rhodochaete parvula]ARO91296.1 50S ribosomal protein L4 [Rhodochaete parvula]
MTSQQIIKYTIFDWNNKEIGSKEIKLKIADSTANYVVHRALVAQKASRRINIASTKTRSEVRGGGRKPWRQKGTGRARAGSKRSPLWRGGGVIFGPRNTVNYTKKINQKEIKLALQTLLFNRKNNTKVVENFDEQFQQPSTKLLLSAIKQWQIPTTTKTLIICTKKSHNSYLSTKNLKNIDMICCNNLNTVDLLNAKNLIITVDSISKIEEVYNG